MDPSEVKKVLSTAKFGDLIEFAYPIGYSHWGVFDDGHVIHFAAADQGYLMTKVTGYLQTAFPVCGDLLLGETKIRRVPLDKVNVPKGAHIAVSNSCHRGTPSSVDHMKERIHALLDKQYGYKLLTFNCEHFATYVRYGHAMCNQIPGRAKNKECLEATAKFADIVHCKNFSRELFGY